MSCGLRTVQVRPAVDDLQLGVSLGQHRDGGLGLGLFNRAMALVGPCGTRSRPGSLSEQRTDHLGLPLTALEDLANEPGSSDAFVHRGHGSARRSPTASTYAAIPR